MSTYDPTTIVVVVHGACGSGKTTLALAFKEFLKSKGFADVAVSDVDVAYGCHYPELQDRRLDAIKDRKVIIETRQERKL